MFNNFLNNFVIVILILYISYSSIYNQTRRQIPITIMEAPCSRVVPSLIGVCVSTQLLVYRLVAVQPPGLDTIRLQLSSTDKSASFRPDDCWKHHPIFAEMYLCLPLHLTLYELACLQFVPSLWNHHPSILNDVRKSVLCPLSDQDQYSIAQPAFWLAILNGPSLCSG